MIDYFMMEAKAAILDLKKNNPGVSDDEVMGEIMDFMEVLTNEYIISDLESRIEAYLEKLNRKIKRSKEGSKR